MLDEHLVETNRTLRPILPYSISPQSGCLKGIFVCCVANPILNATSIAPPNSPPLHNQKAMPILSLDYPHLHKNNSYERKMYSLQLNPKAHLVRPNIAKHSPSHHRLPFRKQAWLLPNFDRAASTKLGADNPKSLAGVRPMQDKATHCLHRATPRDFCQAENENPHQQFVVFPNQILECMRYLNLNTTV